MQFKVVMVVYGDSIIMLVVVFVCVFNFSLQGVSFSRHFSFHRIPSIRHFWVECHSARNEFSGLHF